MSDVLNTMSDVLNTMTDVLGENVPEKIPNNILNVHHNV